MSYIYGIWFVVLIIWVIKTDQSGAAAGYNWLLPAGVLAAAIHAVYFFINKKKKNSVRTTNVEKPINAGAANHTTLKINKVKYEPTPYGREKGYMWEKVNHQLAFGDRKKFAKSVISEHKKFVQKFGSFPEFMSLKFSEKFHYVESNKQHIDSYDMDGCSAALAGLMLLQLIVIGLLEDDPEAKKGMDLFLELQQEFTD